jgi:hypothetical protein
MNDMANLAIEHQEILIFFAVFVLGYWLGIKHDNRG